MKLRAEGHEERCQATDKEMQELLEKTLSGQRKELMKKMWKEECVKQEIRSKESWENSNEKWIAKYESEFTTFFASKNPFVSDEEFYSPNIRNKPAREQQQQPINNAERTGKDSGTDKDIIITGVSTYAEAAKLSSNNQPNAPCTTFIGKRVNFNKQNLNRKISKCKTSL